MENRAFWKTVKHFLAEKSKKDSKITLIEDNQVSHKIRNRKYLTNIS